MTSITKLEKAKVDAQAKLKEPTAAIEKLDIDIAKAQADLDLEKVLKLTDERTATLGEVEAILSFIDSVNNELNEAKKEKTIQELISLGDEARKLEAGESKAIANVVKAVEALKKAADAFDKRLSETSDKINEVRALAKAHGLDPSCAGKIHREHLLGYQLRGDFEVSELIASARNSISQSAQKHGVVTVVNGFSEEVLKDVFPVEFH